MTIWGSCSGNWSGKNHLPRYLVLRFLKLTNSPRVNNRPILVSPRPVKQPIGQANSTAEFSSLKIPHRRRKQLVSSLRHDSLRGSRPTVRVGHYIPIKKNLTDRISLKQRIKRRVGRISHAFTGTHGINIKTQRGHLLTRAFRVFPNNDNRR